MPEEITETTAGALAQLDDQLDEFWPVFDADELDADTKAGITLLAEVAQDNIKAARKILHDLAELD